MGYYTRCFCTSTEVPTINTALGALRDRGFNLTAKVDDEAALSSPDWNDFELIYAPERKPILVECNRDDGQESLCRRECAEFIDEFLGPEGSPARDRVAAHLRATRFTIACQLLMDIDDAGCVASGEFLHYFVEQCGGMVQADGEGFYEGSELILPIE
ncbi:MAG: hypothetical protein JW889_16810 [Verrucomicrobia bacterium]|nr:hypothetical protein [Verrucomicrobiota bacterium]